MKTSNNPITNRRAYLFRVLILTSLMLFSTSASARFLTNEFSVRGMIPLALWASDVASKSGSDRFGIAWLFEENEGGLLYPYFGWYSSTGFSTAGRLSGYPISGSSSYPKVDCSALGPCMVTWVIGGLVYAQKVESYGSDSAVWTVNSDGKALSSNVVAGSSRFVVAWTTIDNTIAMRYVDAATGPEGSVVSIAAGSGCTVTTPNLTYNTTGNAVAMVYGCLQGTGYMRAYDYGNNLNYLWGDTIIFPPSSSYVYSPDIAADKQGNFFLVWKSDLTSSARIYGQRLDKDGTRLGSIFAVSPSNDEQSDPHLSYDPFNDEHLVVFKQVDDIYYARIKSDGTPAGAAYAVTTAVGEQLAPVAAYKSSLNTHLIIWIDRRGLIETIWGRRMAPERMLGDHVPFSNEVGDPGEQHYFQAPARADQWQAVALRPSASSDFDLHLYDGPDYSRELANSMNGTGYVDVVMMNGHQTGPSAYFPLAKHYSGDSYVVEYAPRTGQITQNNPSTNVSMRADSVVSLFEVYTKAGQLLDIQVAPGAADLGVALFDPAKGAQQGIWDAAVSADQNGAGQAENFHFLPSQDGWMALLIWKNDDTIENFVISSGGAGTPPDYDIYLPLVVHLP